MKDLKMYINGQFCESSNGKWIDVLNPSTEEVISRQPEGTIEDVNRALDAARAAQRHARRAQRDPRPVGRSEHHRGDGVFGVEFVEGDAVFGRETVVVEVGAGGVDCLESGHGRFSGLMVGWFDGLVESFGGFADWMEGSLPNSTDGWQRESLRQGQSSNGAEKP